MVNKLIEAGPDINDKWWDGRRVLQPAACLGHEAVAEILIKAGPHIHTAAIPGGLPSYIKAAGPLMAAVAGGSPGHGRQDSQGW